MDLVGHGLKVWFEIALEEMLNWNHPSKQFYNSFAMLVVPWINIIVGRLSNKFHLLLERKAVVVFVCLCVLVCVCVILQRNATV